jgi:hypothetical protein
VRLVGVTGRQRDPGQPESGVLAARGERQHALQPKDPGQRLRTVADRRVESAPQLALTDPDRVAQAVDVPQAVRLEHRHRARDQTIGTLDRRQAAGQMGLQDLMARLRRRGGE